VPPSVRVLYVPVIGAPSPQPVDARGDALRQLVGGALRPLPVGSSDRLALYVRDDSATEPVNLRASRAFGGDIRGNAVLAALRPMGALDDLLDTEVALWSYRAGALGEG
jgi:hypothetical protein